MAFFINLFLSRFHAFFPSCFLYSSLVFPLFFFSLSLSLSPSIFSLFTLLNFRVWSMANVSLVPGLVRQVSSFRISQHLQHGSVFFEGTCFSLVFQGNQQGNQPFWRGPLKKDTARSSCDGVVCANATLGSSASVVLSHISAT